MSLKRLPEWKVYKEQMSQLDYGDALWEPAPPNRSGRIQIGDVGYVRRGCFHLLFSAGRPLGERQIGADVPPAFDPLVVGPIITLDPRLPGYLSTDTVQEIGAGLGTSTCVVPMLEPGFSVLFESSEKQGAALVTKYSTYREDIQREQNFEEYTKRHYDSWVAFARETGHGNDVKPVLVAGVDMTKNFAMMSYSGNSVRLRSEFTVSIAGTSSGSVWGTWRTEGSAFTNLKCGPLSPLPPDSTTHIAAPAPGGINHPEAVSEYNQCVFVRYYTMRKRPLLPPKVIKAGAGPHDLGPGSQDGKESPCAAQHDSDSDSAPSLFDDDGSDDRSSVTSMESESDIVIRNTTTDERDDFDVIADYIFRNSHAISVIIHHRDLALLRKVGNTTDMSALVLAKRPLVVIDGDGVGRIQHGTNPATGSGSPRFDSDFDLAVFETFLGHIDSIVAPRETPTNSRKNGVRIPQRCYRKGVGRGPGNQNLVLFFREDGSYLPLSAALEEDYTGLISCDAPVFPNAVYNITLRIEWLGYPPQDFQVRVHDRYNNPSRLGTEVSKAIQEFVKTMSTQKVDPEDEQWRVGPGRIGIEHLLLGGLEQVSAGSWQAHLFYKPRN